MMRVHVLQFIFLSLYFSVRRAGTLSARRLLAVDVIPIAPPRTRRMLHSAGNVARCRALCRRGGRIHQAVVAALYAAMILVARNQKNDAGVAVGKDSLTGNLSVIVDVVCTNTAVAGRQRDAGTRKKKRLQIHHGAVLPQKGVEEGALARVVGIDLVAWRSHTDSLVVCVDTVGYPCCVSVEDPQVRHDAILPEKRVVELVLIAGSAGGANRRDVRLPDDVARVVEPLRCGVHASQGAQVRDDAMVPDKGMPGSVARQIHRAQHLATLIQPSGDAKGSPERAGRSIRDDVVHGATLPEKRAHGRAAGHRVDVEVHVAAAGNLPLVVYEEGRAVGAPQSAEVLHGSAAPQEGARFGSISKVEEVVIRRPGRKWIGSRVQGSPDHVAVPVDCASPAFVPTERPQIHDLAPLPQTGQARRQAGERIGCVIKGLSGDGSVLRNRIGEYRPGTVKARRLGSERGVLGQYAEIGLDAVLPAEGIIHQAAVVAAGIGNQSIAAAQNRT